MADEIVQVSGGRAEGGSPFDAIRQEGGQGEFWSARDLMPLLGYSRWDRVPEVIERAQAACTNAGNLSAEHFSEEARKSSTGRSAQDFRLSRYACSLVAMNGDPRKPEIAAAQTYFAIKTRQAELQDEAAAKPQSTADLLLMYAQAYKEHETRLNAIEEENRLLREALSLAQQQATEAKQLAEVVDMETAANTAELERFKNGHGYWFSIAGWCGKNGYRLGLSQMRLLGRKAAVMCRTKGIQPVPVTDPRYGQVNTYPDVVLMELTWS